MSWKKIHCFDDWGNLSVVYGDSAKQLVGGRHKFKWPDGSEKEIDVVFYQKIIEVRGRGEPHTVKRQEPYINVHWRGLKFVVSLFALLGEHEFFIWGDDPSQQENAA